MAYDLKDLVCHCEARWGSGSYTSSLAERIRVWLSNATNDEVEILVKLLRNFDYYPNRRASICLQEIHSRLEERLLEIIGQEKNIYDNVLFFPVTKKNGARNSAQHIYNLYTSNITKHCCKMNIDTVIINDVHRPFDYVDHVVFIDDMIGTGQSIKKFFKQTLNKHPFLKDKKLYLVVLEACPEGIEVIKKFLEPIGIEIFYSNLHLKAFAEERVFNKEELARAIEIVESLELRISDDDGKHVMGYGRSEALMAFSHNTPNNTISSFWKKNDLVGWIPLFSSRDHYVPSYMRESHETVSTLSQDKKQRDNFNYALKKRGLK